MALCFVLAGCWVATMLTRATLPAPPQGSPTSWRGWARRKTKELCAGVVSFTAASHGVESAVADATEIAGALQEEGQRRDASVLAITRIFINYLSTTSLLADFQLDWGSSLRWVFGMQKVLSGALPPLMDCAGLDFVTQSSLTLGLPAAIIGGPIALIALWHVPHLRVVKKLRRQGGAWTVPGLTMWSVPPWQVLPNAMLTLAFLLWPSFVASLLKMVDCSVVVDGVSYVVSDLTMRCDSDEHQRLAGIATFFLATLVPAFPLGIAWLLQRNQDKLDEEAFSQRFSFLYVGYTHRDWEGTRFTLALCGRSCAWQLRSKLFVWWECVVMARKFLLVAVTVWFGRNPNYQICA
jgi:hypothetical protein